MELCPSTWIMVYQHDVEYFGQRFCKEQDLDLPPGKANILGFVQIATNKIGGDLLKGHRDTKNPSEKYADIVGCASYYDRDICDPESIRRIHVVAGRQCFPDLWEKVDRFDQVDADFSQFQRDSGILEETYCGRRNLCGLNTNVWIANT